jgi:hypothetical protein
VVVEMTLDERGEVSDARVVSGPDELRKAALEAVLTWHYSPSAISSTVTHATLRFHLPPAGFEKHLWDEREATDGEKGQLRAWAVERPEAEKLAWSEVEKPFQIDDYQFEYKAKHRDWEITHPELGIITEKIHSIQVDGIAGGVPGGVSDGVAGGVPGGVAGGVPGGVPGEIRGADVEIVGPGYVLSGKQLVLRIEAEERLALFDGAPPLAGVRTERVPESWAKEVLAQAGVAIGDAISEDTAKRIRQVARDIDEHFRVEFHKDPAGLIITIVTR